jgi:antitoxin component YwqK of YwqJK toxin-antitoxin module
MKKMILITLMMVSGVIFAQGEPQLEAVGQLVKATYYYDNGNIWSEVEFFDGLFWNVLYNNDINGNPKEKGSLVNGNGTRNIYDERGNLIMIEMYEKGLLQKATYK